MKTVFITGATAGIGREMARQYRAMGWRVLFCGRRKDRLTALELELDPTRSGLAQGFEVDVANPTEFQRVLDWVTTKKVSLDRVVANAGFGVSGSFAKLSPEDYHRQFGVNFFGVMNSIRPFLSLLQESKGAIGIVGSGNSYLALAGASPYCTSKFAVRAFSECLRIEQRPKGVSVTLICPGFVKTEIHNVDNNGVFREDAPPSGIPSWIEMSAEKAASLAIRGIERRKPEIWITFHVRIFILLELYLRPVSRFIRSKMT